MRWLFPILSELILIVINTSTIKMDPVSKVLEGGDIIFVPLLKNFLKNSSSSKIYK